jgi:phosphoribosylanthranilate isomerase
MTRPENITEADLREQFDRCGLASLMTFERAIQSGAILISLIAAIKGRRTAAARRAQFVAIQYQQTQEAA